MVVLLPKLVMLVAAVLLPSTPEQPEHPVSPALPAVGLYGLDHLSGTVLLEVAKDVGKGVLATGRYQQVYVVAHDAPCMYVEALLPLAVPQALQHDVHIELPCEHVCPLHHRKGDKVDGLLVPDLVSSYWHKANIRFYERCLAAFVTSFAKNPSLETPDARDKF